MNKSIEKLIKEWSYFLSNVLMGVIVVFLSDYSLILCLLRHKSVTAFLNKKKRSSS